MTRIVGRKVERYLTVVKNGAGRSWTVTHHQIITELHATKGWREISHERKEHRVKRLPPMSQWRAADISIFERNPDLGDTRPPKLERVVVLTETRMIKAMLRHRERRRDIQIAENIARNKLEDQRLAGLR